MGLLDLFIKLCEKVRGVRGFWDVLPGLVAICGGLKVLFVQNLIMVGTFVLKPIMNLHYIESKMLSGELKRKWQAGIFGGPFPGSHNAASR